MNKKTFVLIIVLLLSSLNYTYSQEKNAVSENKNDTTSINHRIAIEYHPDYILPTNSFLRGYNETGKHINYTYSTHLKYSFQYNPNSTIGKIYKGLYQGIGLSFYNFKETKYFGNPFCAYLFQGAQISQISNNISLNYEWNLGLSFNWKTYDFNDNPYNVVIGSKINAYINANLYFNWILSQHWDLVTGFTASHFSNGNTKIPNAGLNTTGIKIGLIYNFNRQKTFQSSPDYNIPKFPKHINYDLVVFGSLRRTGINIDGQKIASPDSYTVLGFNFSPMYNLGYKFRTGISLDGIYDGSANIYEEDHIVPMDGSSKNSDPFIAKPPFNKQIALGLSGRVEYVMPIFTINAGGGYNMLGHGSLKSFYQILALKMNITKDSYIHIGYNLKNLHTPNYLMIGFGFRFGNKYPSLFY